MFAEIKIAKNGNKYLKIWFGWNNKTIFIFENQKELIKEILNKLNIVDSADIADLNYLKDKLNICNSDIYYEVWKDFNNG